MAAMLSAAAQRIEPASARRRRRWPVLAAGLITAAGLSATAAYLLKRRAAAKRARVLGPGQTPPARPCRPRCRATWPPATPTGASAPADRNRAAAPCGRPVAGLLALTWDHG